MKKVFILVFIVISSACYFFLNNFYNHLQNKELEEVTIKYVKAYELVYEEKKQLAQILLTGLKSLSNLEELLSKLPNATEKEKNLIRNQIANALKDRYSHLQKLGIWQVHIHLPNNESFLRLHKPSLYGDNLKDIRPSVEYVSRYKKPIDTPEEGRVKYGYRFVYPLFKDSNYVGSIEISFGVDSFIKTIMHHYDVFSNFFLKTSLSIQKNFKDESSIYKPSHHEGYSYDTNVLKELKLYSNKTIEQLKPSKEFTLKLKQMGEQNSSSSIYNEKINAIFTVIPIDNKLTKEQIGFLTIRSKPDYIISFYHYRHYFTVASIGLLGLLFFVAYILIAKKRRETFLRLEIEKEKKQFEILLNHAVDGIHILDEDGNVAFCSDSFATMLGYTKEEVKRLNVKQWDISLPEGKIFSEIQRLIETKREFVTKHRKKDGSIIDVSIHAAGVAINGINYLYATSRDITESLILQNELEEKNALLLQVKALAHLGYWKFDLIKNTLEWSDEIFKIFEIEKNTNKISFELFMEFVHPLDREKVRKSYLNSLENKEAYEIEHRIILRDGRIKYVTEKCETKFDNDGNPLISLGSILDNTYQHKIIENLQRFIDAQENLVILSSSEELKFANQKFFEFFGVKDIEGFQTHFGHKVIAEIFVRNDRFFHLEKLKNQEDWINHLKQLAQSERIVSLVDQYSHVHAFSLALNDFGDDTTIISFTDISETLIHQIDLEDKVIHDKLTNAYNREYFEQNYKRLLKLYSSRNNKFALALLDIDYFKRVNDNYGHEIGDTVLQEFVQVIKKHSRKDDILIRWGGEEFILVLPVSSEENLQNALDNLRQAIEREHFSSIGSITCSIGGTIYIDNEDITTTVKRADEAVYTAKASGRNNVVLYT